MAPSAQKQLSEVGAHERCRHPSDRASSCVKLKLQRVLHRRFPPRSHPAGNRSMADGRGGASRATLPLRRRLGHFEIRLGQCATATNGRKCRDHDRPGARPFRQPIGGGRLWERQRTDSGLQRTRSKAGAHDSKHAFILVPGRDRPIGSSIRRRSWPDLGLRAWRQTADLSDPPRRRGRARVSLRRIRQPLCRQPLTPRSVFVPTQKPGHMALSRSIRDGVDHPEALAVGPSGELFVANSPDCNPPCGKGSVTVYPPGSSKPMLRITDGVDAPFRLAVDSTGVLYVANTPLVRHIHPRGWISVYAPGGIRPMRKITDGVRGPIALALDPSDNLYVANAYDDSVTVYSPGGATLLYRLPRASASTRTHSRSASYSRARRGARRR